MTVDLTVEVVFAGAESQFVAEVRLARGATVREAITASGVATAFPEINVCDDNVGVWGRKAKLDGEVHEGDRVEIYRPLVADPKETRRRRARKKASKQG